jgi:hypothetical protein
MKRFLKYPSAIISSFALATPAFAQLKLPTPPPTGTNAALTGSGVVDIITTGVNYLITVSVVLAVAAFIYGGIVYAVYDPKKGRDILKNAAIGLLAILGVGLLINTIAAWIQRGLGLG